jgi:excinuclease ABC subunit A
MHTISVRGARTHNLKNIDLELPRDKLIVITGLSGSGKSSLAFDTLYAEGQRRYVESLSAYARQFLSLMEKPDVDHIEGLSPAISIEQKSVSHNPRSTVGTITEIYDYLRLLFARVGTPHCPKHQTPLTAQTISQMVDNILLLPENSKILLLSPVVQARKGEHIQQLETLKSQGFVRARIDGDIYELTDAPKLDPRKKHTIEVVVDRLKINVSIQSRLADSLETAVNLSNGLVNIQVVNDHHKILKEFVYSSKFACTHCGYSLLELEPRLFSFNNPSGACSTCDGLGVKPFVDPERAKLYDDPEKQLNYKTCSACNGTRLKETARNVFIENHALPDITAYSIANTLKFFETLKLTGAKGQIANKILKEIISRLEFLMNVGLEYLSLNRTSDTLSGGETQRIRLASQIGAGLVGVMYVLDEPSIGLHQRDNARLLKTLNHLRDLGNTVIVVEHDEEAILSADHVVDIGPGAGVHGGNIVAIGTPKQIMKNTASLTGQYLSGKRSIPIPKIRRKIDKNRLITLNGASGNNLKNINVDFPVGLITCITGVSGSGKSTLINDTLYPVAAKLLNDVKQMEAHAHTEITGLQYLDKVIDIDQSPIGRTPRSNPATYTGLFTEIRDLFSNTEEARSRGYKPGRFSFNVKGGRCEACEGDGLIKVEMHFLPDVYVPCDVCHSKRYNRETLEVFYKGKNIHEVLEMTVEDALVFFKPVPPIARKLETLVDVGLAYIKIGQSATTLSGGEAQRIKLSKELSKRDTGKTLYILDEPTTGLHFHDVKHLLEILERLAKRGNTIIIIEHNLDVIKTADWIIDLGPEGGDRGGEIVAVGTPEAIAKVKGSYTGQFLKPLLNFDK